MAIEKKIRKARTPSKTFNATLKVERTVNGEINFLNIDAFDGRSLAKKLNSLLMDERNGDNYTISISSINKVIA